MLESKTCCYTSEVEKVSAKQETKKSVLNAQHCICKNGNTKKWSVVLFGKAESVLACVGGGNVSCAWEFWWRSRENKFKASQSVPSPFFARLRSSLWSLADILQTADVVRRICIFAILASTAIWPSQSVWNFPTFSTVLPKQAEFHAFFWRLSCGTDVILLAPTSICQIWSRLAGYEPLAGGFEWIMMQVTGANQNTQKIAIYWFGEY